MFSIRSIAAVAIVLVLAWLASRASLDVGIALGLLGVVLVHWRARVAIAVVALGTAAVYGSTAVLALVAGVGLIGFAYSAVAGAADLGGLPSSRDTTPAAKWWGFSDGWGRDRSSGGG